MTQWWKLFDQQFKVALRQNNIRLIKKCLDKYPIDMIVDIDISDVDVPNLSPEMLSLLRMYGIIITGGE